MPVEAQTVEYTYFGNGTSKVFPFPARFLSNADILVGLDGVQQLSGFSVSGAGAASGGNVTFLAAPGNAVKVTLIRNPPDSQLIDFINGQTILEGVLDNALDKLTMIAQYLRRVLNRSIRLSDFDPSVAPPLPGVNGRANRFLAFDLDGNPTVVANIGDVAAVPFASQAEAEGAAALDRIMSPGRTKQQIDARLATKAEAEAGTEPTHLMTPLRVAQAIAARGGGTVSGLPAFDTRGLAALANLATSVTVFLLNGYAARGDGGGGFYKRLASTPSPSKPWHIQTTDGAWWQLDTPDIHPRQLGALGDNAADDTVAMQAWLDYAAAFGVTARLGAGVYRVPSATLSISSGTYIEGDNSTATIRRSTDTPAPLLQADTRANVAIVGVRVDTLAGPQSSSSVAAGTGTKVFTIPAGLSFAPGDAVIAQSATSGSLYMTGTVTTYSGTTLTCNMTAVQGSGTVSNWVIGKYTNANSAIHMLNCTNSRVERCIVSGRFYIGIVAENGDGLALNDNEVRGVFNRAVYAYAVSGVLDDIEIAGNWIAGAGFTNYGINHNGSTGGTLTNSKVVNNNIESTVYQGIMCGGGVFGVTVQGNHVAGVNDPAGVGIVVQNANGQVPVRVTVAGNVVESCTIGIDVINSFNVSVANNNINNCPNAIQLRRAGSGSCYNHSVVGNICTSYTACGIRAASDNAASCGQSTIMGNVLTGTGVSAQGVNFDANTDRLILIGNVLQFNSGGAPTGGTNHVITNNITT